MGGGFRTSRRHGSQLKPARLYSGVWRRAAGARIHFGGDGHHLPSLCALSPEFVRRKGHTIVLMGVGGHGPGCRLAEIKPCHQVSLVVKRAVRPGAQRRSAAWVGWKLLPPWARSSGGGIPKHWPCRGRGNVLLHLALGEAGDTRQGCLNRRHCLLVPPNGPLGQ